MPGRILANGSKKCSLSYDGLRPTRVTQSGRFDGGSTAMSWALPGVSTFSGVCNRMQMQYLLNFWYYKSLWMPIGRLLATFLACALTHLTTSKETS